METLIKERKKPGLSDSRGLAERRRLTVRRGHAASYNRLLVKVSHFIIFDRVWTQPIRGCVCVCVCQNGKSASAEQQDVVQKLQVTSAVHGAVHAHLPAQRLQLADFGGQKDAECDGVRGAGEGAGDDGASH